MCLNKPVYAKQQKERPFSEIGGIAQSYNHLKLRKLTKIWKTLDGNFDCEPDFLNPEKKIVFKNR